MVNRVLIGSNALSTTRPTRIICKGGVRGLKTYISDVFTLNLENIVWSRCSLKDHFKGHRRENSRFAFSAGHFSLVAFLMVCAPGTLIRNKEALVVV